MLARVGLTTSTFTVDNFGAPSANMGTSVVPGASNALGSWTTAIAGGSVTSECTWVYVRVANGSTASTAKGHLLDIGVDPAGGTAYVVVASNIVCGASSTSTTGAGHEFMLPITVPAGASIGVRIRGSAATAGTVRVSLKAFGGLRRPELVPSAQYHETIGAETASSAGTSITPGNGAFSSWILLGTTTRDLWWWQLGIQVANSTITAEYTNVELGYGDGTSGGTITILERSNVGNTSEACISLVNGNLRFLACYQPVPAGTNIYVRAWTNNAPDSGYSAAAIGFGG